MKTTDNIRRTASHLEPTVYCPERNAERCVAAMREEREAREVSQ